MALMREIRHKLMFLPAVVLIAKLFTFDLQTLQLHSSHAVLNITFYYHYSTIFDSRFGRKKPKLGVRLVNGLQAITSNNLFFNCSIIKLVYQSVEKKGPKYCQREVL